MEKKIKKIIVIMVLKQPQKKGTPCDTNNNDNIFHKEYKCISNKIYFTGMITVEENLVVQPNNQDHSRVTRISSEEELHGRGPINLQLTNYENLPMSHWQKCTPGK